MGTIGKYLPLIFFLLVSQCCSLFAQVKITDGISETMNPNSLLELESSTRGLLPPRLALASLYLPDPLVAPVPEGMLVYSLGGGVSDGFYYWNDLKWEKLEDTGTTMMISRSVDADCVLSASDNLVFASNDITVTLPQVTTADTGIVITVIHSGSNTDLVKITGFDGALINDSDTVRLMPGICRSFVSRGTEWVIKDFDGKAENLIDVGRNCGFRTLPDALAFLKEHMDRPAVIRLTDEVNYLNETQVIDLPFPLTIQGLSFGMGSIAAGAGLSGKAMFRCISECYLKMLVFDATTVAGYGAAKGEDAVRFVGDATYNEVKDCTFEGFYNTIVDSSDSELWIFECDIYDSHNAGILIHGSVLGANLKVAETDFIHCRKGVLLEKGSQATVQLYSGQYLNEFETDSAIIYRPSTFSFESMVISGNSWNTKGKSITGFDFSRTDGRDANAYIEGNTGSEDKKPGCEITVSDNLSSFTCQYPSTWYKASWVNNSSTSVSWLIQNNRITYLPSKSRNIIVTITGNISVNNSNRVITLALIKNSNGNTRYGESNLRITAADQPFQFATVAYLKDVAEGDFFELFFSSRNGGDVLTVQDINWVVTSQ